MNHDVFISYSSKNSTAAQAICHELEDKGIKCWMAPRDIPVGAKYASVITKAIVGCRIVVLVFSDDAARSPWVESEINIAFSNRKTIVPYKIDTANIEDYEEFYLMLNNRHWIEAYPDYKTRFKELVTIVAQALGKSIPALKPIEKQIQEQKIVAIAKKTVKFVLLFIFGTIVLLVCLRLTIVLFEKVGKGDRKTTYVSTAEYEYTSNDNIKKRNITNLLTSQDSSFSKIENNGKYGFEIRGKVVVKAKYDEVYPFHDGMARVVLDNKTGFIDKLGREVIELKYDDAIDFYNGLAGVKFQDKWSYIDKVGRVVILDLSYDKVFPFNEEGLAKVELKGKHGYIDKEGKEIISFKYDWVKYFQGGLLLVSLNGLYGYVNKEGEEVIPLKYQLAWPYYRDDGLIKVCLDGKSGYIDTSGKEVVPLKYDDVDSFSEGLASVRLAEKYAFVNKEGKRITSLKYDWTYSFSEGLAVVNVGGCIVDDRFGGGKWGYIDKTGKEVIPLKYDSADSFSEGLAAVKLNGKWGYIDKTGKDVIPLRYDYVESFSEGLARVKLDDKLGFIDKAGKEVIPLKYDDVLDFYNGKAIAKLNGETFYIDKDGNRIEE